MITNNEKGAGREKEKDPELRSAASIQPITDEKANTQGKSRERAREKKEGEG